MYENLPLIERHPLFQSIEKADALAVLQCLGAYVSTYHASQNILDEAACSGKFCIILSGALQPIRKDCNGQATMIDIFYADCPLNIGSFAAYHKTSSIVLQPKDYCELLFVSQHRVINTCVSSCAAHRRFTANLMLAISTQQLHMMDRIEILQKKTMRERITTWLTQQTQRTGLKEVVSPMGRIELAEYLGVDRSALTRELTHMRLDGLIDYHKNTFCLCPNACRMSPIESIS